MSIFRRLIGPGNRGDKLAIVPDLENEVPEKVGVRDGAQLGFHRGNTQPVISPKRKKIKSSTRIITSPTIGPCRDLFLTD
jgi:hypothetical protein